MPDLPQIKDITAPIATDMDTVNAIIIERLHSNLNFIAELSHHIIKSGGKRLRPLLVLLSARAYGYDGNTHTLLAAIIEFIHTATLLHDDVVDNAYLRRGQKTAKTIWGNNASVLVGDFLYSRAFQMIVESGLPRVTNILADTTNTIAEGEVRQLLNCQQTNVEESDYLEVIRCKTAKLFEASMRIGAIVAGASTEAEHNATQLGLNIGIAFQLIDDVLDYEIHSDTGKSPGNDLAEGKPTLPFIYTLKRCSPSDAKLLKETLHKKDKPMIQDAIKLIRANNALDYTRQQANLHANRAQTALSALPDSPYKVALQQLINFTVERSH